MRARVANLSERPLALGGGQGGHRIEAIVSPHESTWQAVLTLLDAEGRSLAVRTVQGRTPSCGSIDVAAAVVIATMLDGLPAEDSPVRAGPSQPAAADGGDTLLGAFVGASPGLIPSAWLGGGIELLLGWAVPVIFEATVYAPAEHTDAMGRGARLWGFHAGGGICPELLQSGQVDLRICVTAQAGLQLATGIGLTSGGDSTLPLALLKVGPKLRYELTKALSAQLAVSAGWNVLRPEVHWNIEAERRELKGDLIVLLAQFGLLVCIE